MEGPLSNLQVSLLQFGRPKQTYRGPQRFQMAYQRASNVGPGVPHRGMNGPAHSRHNFNGDNSVIGYIPDDVSSVQSSSLGGVGVNNSLNYPPMFGGFADTWPTLPNGRSMPGRGADRMRNGFTTSSVAGESVAASELTDATSTMDGTKNIGQGGVSLGGMSINDMAKATSLSQSDRLKRYMEANDRSVNGGYRNGPSIARDAVKDDDDARSISTSFASQIDVGTYD